MSRLWGSINLRGLRPFILVTASMSALASNQGPPPSDEPFLLVDYGVSADHHTPPRNVLSIDPKKELIGLNDSFEPLEPCEEPGLAACFQSSALTFGIPSGELHIGRRWLVGNRHFSVAGRETVRLLGQAEQVLRIVSEGEEQSPHSFYFSCKHGLRMVVLPLGYLGTASAHFAEGESGIFAGACSS